ncbi:MAG: hypothetical protein WAN79_09565, partial [Opitutaceae bacterium]
MESDADDRFDPQVAIDLLLAIAQKPSLDEIVETLKRFLLSRPGVSRIRMWLTDKSDNCLHAVADGANPQPDLEVNVGLHDPDKDPF